MRFWDVWKDIRRYGLSTAALKFLLAVTGLLVWTGFSIWSGLGEEAGFRLREAWDTPAYLYLGLPIMVLAVGLSAFHIPSRAWRWPLWLVGGHQAGVMLVGVGMQSALSLLILTLVLAILLGAFFAVPAFVGSMLARNVEERAL
jgi:hypothetical protein